MKCGGRGLVRLSVMKDPKLLQATLLLQAQRENLKDVKDGIRMKERGKQ